MVKHHYVHVLWWLLLAEMLGELALCLLLGECPPSPGKILISVLTPGLPYSSGLAFGGYGVTVNPLMSSSGRSGWRL